MVSKVQPWHRLKNFLKYSIKSLCYFYLLFAYLFLWTTSHSVIFQGTPVPTPTFQLHVLCGKCLARMKAYGESRWPVIPLSVGNRVKNSTDRPFASLLFVVTSSPSSLPPHQSVVALDLATNASALSHICSEKGPFCETAGSKRYEGSPEVSPSVGLPPVPPLLHRPEQILVITAELLCGNSQRILASAFPLKLRNVRFRLNLKAFHWHLFTLYLPLQGLNRQVEKKECEEYKIAP